MIEDGRLVHSLINGIVAKLPDVTGVDAPELYDNEVLRSARETLVEVSRYAIGAVFKRLVSILDDFSKKDLASTPLSSQTEQSEIFIVELLADCCRAHWKSIREAASGGPKNGSDQAISPNAGNSRSAPRPSHMDLCSSKRLNSKRLRGPHVHSAYKPSAHGLLPPGLPDTQVVWFLEVLTRISSSIPDNVHLPSSTLLEMGPYAIPYLTGACANETSLYDGYGWQNDIDRATSEVIEYLSASNWQTVFSYIQGKLRTLRDLGGSGPQGGSSSAPGLTEPETKAIKGLGAMAHLWVDGRKLTILLKELCVYFLNLSKASQNVVAIVLPQTIARWLDNNSPELVNLHRTEKRLDGSADILFDMSNSMLDEIHRKPFLWPLQASLIILIPEVFRVAGAMGHTKTGTISKKVAFLEGLRKGLGSSRASDTATFCLVGLCRIAHHFPVDSESALLSYALDVQNEIKAEIFGQAFSVQSAQERVLDVHLIIAAFICFSYLDLQSTVEALVPKCFQHSAPMELKLAVFETCNIIAQQPDGRQYSPLFAAVAPYIRDFFQGLHFGPDFLIEEFNSGNISVRERPESVSVRVVLRSVLEFLAQRPETLVDESITPAAAYHEYLDEALEIIVMLLADHDERVRTCASSIAHILITEHSLVRLPRDRSRPSNDSVLDFWRSTSLLLSSISTKIIDHCVHEYGVKAMISVINGVLLTRLTLLRRDSVRYFAGMRNPPPRNGSLILLQDVQKSLENGAEIPERGTASEDLEVAFLVLLCSSNLDICAAVTSSLALFCQEGSLTENSADLSHSGLTIMRNIDAYSELSSPKYRLTGMVAFQKRFRKCLRHMTRPSTGILTAWEFVFSRWSHINNEILAPRSENDNTNAERSLMEWRNYAGFLASLGGCCVTDTSQNARIDEAMIAGLRWIDRVSPKGDGQSLLDRFLSQCLQLLFCNNLRIREATREVLGVELSARLFPYLLQALESELMTLFKDSTNEPSRQTWTIVLEQVASLLKAMVEHLNDIREPFFSADFESMSLELARYADSLPTDAAMLRVKIKICQLCETVSCRRGAMSLGHAIRIRNQLLAIIFAWLSRPAFAHIDPLVSSGTLRTDEVLRYQRDLNRACLRALVSLTYRLPLQISAEQNDADSFEPKTQLFFDYFKRLLSQLEDEATQLDRRNDNSLGSYRLEEFSSGLDLTISALSNLLSANIDIGLKHALDMGYHENIQVRTAFLRVLCNILSQEAEFERLSNTAVMEKYNLLLEAITHDMGLVVVLSNSCSSGDVDELAISLLNIFESRGMSFQLLKTLIEHEVAITVNETELLRRHCVTTKILSAYARWKGSAYLRSTMQQVLQRLIHSSKDLDLELDPTRSTSPEDLEQNAVQLQRVTQIFIEDICKSASSVPATFRRICHTIATAVTPRFPQAKFTAVGAFIFLRFFCPAIVAPDTEGLVASVPTKEMRRGLLLVAKVVQNLANNVLFGVKEQYMSPLNDFLALNIYRVTAFLRDISAYSPVVEDEQPPESFDFGSCVVLHRFLFDHWDDVRQKVLARERRSWQASPADSDSDTQSTQQPASLNQLSEIIPSLGTPQLDVSWNSPQISTNTPHAYSRFQEFMFRNVRRNAETIASSRAIYDGGQSRDGMPVICVILKTIEQESIDFDLLLFTFLKIASRIWHRRFGVLVIRKVSSLSPCEISKNFCRFYIYNMNSVYRKCSRRILRLVAKDANNIFNPTTVDYHLVGSLQELQVHFHLGSLQLPKETISVVTDSRFVFQPVMRLSKTKGKIDVIVKVGSQYVQITTTKKQDIGPGFRLSGTVNDIFRIADIEEAKASGPMDGETAFGFRTESRTIVMYFVSPRKAEILQAIRSAKAKHRKEFKSSKSYDRLIRPDDVPGSLLNVSLMNLANRDRALRLASYNTIAGLSKAFHFDIDKELITAKELDIPANSANLLKGVSEKLARSEPALTYDFLSEFFIGWEKLSSEERPLSVLYMSPWLSNMGRHIMSSENEGEKGKEKTASIARKLIETAIRAPGCTASFQEHAWPVIARDDALTEVFLDEMVKIALESGPGAEQIASVASIAASIGTLTIKGKIIARLRKGINRSSLRPTRTLFDNAVWDEIAVLLRMCLETSFHCRGQSQLFLPEIFHIITMTVHGGSSTTSSWAHSLLINTVHSLCTTFPLGDARLTKLKTVLISLTEPKIELLFDLHRVAASDASATHDLKWADAAISSHLESITNLLQNIIELGAPSNALANAWRSRWMSLVASTAFQSNPAIQPKAFAVMGCLASERVDDDLLYQVLVSLRSGITRCTEEGDSGLLVSIVTTLTKMVRNLPPTSRYIKHLFWLAISLIRLVPVTIFNCAASLLEALVQVLAAQGAFNGSQLASVLLLGRAPAETILTEMDEKFGVRFNQQTFHMALAICLLKGLAESVTQSSTLRVLSTLLEITSNSSSASTSTSTTSAEMTPCPTDKALLSYVLLLATHVTTVNDWRDILWLAGNTSPAAFASPADMLATIRIEEVDGKKLICNAMLIIVNFMSCEAIVQQRTLQFLLRFATQCPFVFLPLIEPLTPILHDILLSSQNTSTIEAAHALTRVVARLSRFSPTIATTTTTTTSPPNDHDHHNTITTTTTLADILTDLGLEGIHTASSFGRQLPPEEMKEFGGLIDRLIELIIV